MMILEAMGVILLVDLVSGWVHWMEDTFWSEETPILGPWLVRPNALHHKDGSVILQNNWFQSSWDLLLVGLMVLAVAAYQAMLTWHVWLFVVIGVNANQIHKWSHMLPSKVPALVAWLQKYRILQSASDHRLHHSGYYNQAYCLITPYSNWLLDRVGFWRGMEMLLVPILGAPRRHDLKHLS